jgi:hypothetical protein
MRQTKKDPGEPRAVVSCPAVMKVRRLSAISSSVITRAVSESPREEKDH